MTNRFRRFAVLTPLSDLSRRVVAAPRPSRRRGHALVPVMVVLFLAAFWPSFGADKADMESFNMVWSTIKSKHWNLAEIGVDWDAVGRKYRPLAEKTHNRLEMRKVMRDMIKELGQSHFNVYGGGDFEKLESSLADFTSGGNGTLGFEVALVDNELFVTKIHDDLVPAESGLKVGSRITGHSGKDLAPLIAKITGLYADVAQGRLYMNRTLNSLFQDTPGLQKKLTFTTSGRQESYTFTMHKPLGTPKTILNLPMVHYRYEDALLADNIGYLHFNIFIPEVKTQFDNETLPKFADADGLIIDLRGNGGGIGFIAVALANRILAEQSKLGTMINSGGSLNFAVFPQKPIFDKPVAILIDGGSASTSEIMAAGLQDLKRARIFGTRSAGAALPSMIEHLPNGDRFQYAIADYVSVSGRQVEGHGVDPDEVTPHSKPALLAGKDAALEAARSWIKAGGQL